MLREIGDRHVTREDEGDGPRKEAERQKDAARDLDHALEVVQSVAGGVADGKPKYFCKPCSRKQSAAMIRTTLRI